MLRVDFVLLVLQTAGVLALVARPTQAQHHVMYVLDDSTGLGRRFDGIGGLSGGGVK